MQVGGSGTIKSDINVTPLVDVVLVLLIIFMVITPVVQMGYLVRVPPKAPAGLPPSAVNDQIILRLMPDNHIFINKDEVPPTDFPHAHPRHHARQPVEDGLLPGLARRRLRRHDEVPGHGPRQRREEHRHHRRSSAVANRHQQDIESGGLGPPFSFVEERHSG